jgi:demethylmenaquinone methyltransferase/2-methoxy-6-polyprenyl-1,4-benzoquinol methylase
MTPDGLSDLLAEQIAYYRARAGEYDASTPLEEESRATLMAALHACEPLGDVLELACGTGKWTRELARSATQLTALDAAPEMLAIAAAKVSVPGVRFIEADVFAWRPDRRYDLVFFAAWLSHVPPQRFAAFWSLVAECVAPQGRVFAIDERPAGEAGEQRIAGAAAPAVLRPLADGAVYRAVKVFYEPAALERSLTALGWSARVQPVGSRFFYLIAEPPIG